MLDRRDESVFRTTAAAGYEQGSGMASFAARAAKIAPQGYAPLTGFRTSPQIPEDILQSLDHPDTLPRKLFGEHLQFMRSAFFGEDKLPVEDNGAL